LRDRGNQRRSQEWVELHASDVTFPGSGFAPTRVTVRVRGETPVRLSGEPRLRGAQGVHNVGREHVRGGPGRDAVVGVPIHPRATAELLPDMGRAGRRTTLVVGDTTARSLTARASRRVVFRSA
jgi:hypothetical protein